MPTRAVAANALASVVAAWLALGCVVSTPAAAADAADLVITPQQRSAAEQVAKAGVPLSELASDAPDSHTVKSGDTLWDIAKLFLKSPWRWPELWGMNLQQIRNPHLIYPGQVLVLIKSGGSARLAIASPLSGSAEAAMVAGIPTVKVSPRVRSSLIPSAAIAAIPLKVIAPFLNEATVFNSDELANAARVVATQEGRMLLSQGEIAYVRGTLMGSGDYRMFREAKPLRDPVTKELLGYEAHFVGSAEFVEAGFEPEDKKAAVVPITMRVTSVREEAGVGDRLAAVGGNDFSAFVPHAPETASGLIASIYGDAINAGQNQIVALNRGRRDGMERGHVLALWRDGAAAVDGTGLKKVALKLPDERIGLLYVFRVFDRVSYALIVSAVDPVKLGDRFSQP
jgi:LysM repeat protein